jgi:hypothetical protein
VVARARLRAAFGGGIEVLHGIPVLLCGIQDMTGTLAFRDVLSWLKQIEMGRGFHTTLRIANDLLACTDVGGSPLAPPMAVAGTSSTPDTATASPSAAVTYNLYLPTGFDTKEFAVFEMCHKMDSSQGIMPICLEKAVELVTNMAEELNQSFMTELGDPTIEDSCDASPSSEGEENSFKELKVVLVGGSHAYRLAVAADNLGLDVENLAMPGFKISDSSIENMVELLGDVVEMSEKRVVIIYQLYDNSVFFAGKQDGSRSLPVKIDKMYHVEGRLEYADHNTIKHLVNSTIPLLRAGGDNEKIILSPLPRYMKPCCRDKTHVTNRKEPDYFANMGTAMREIKDSIKDLVYGKKIRSFKVLEPMTLLEEEEGDLATATKLKSYFDEDPVHLSGDGYADMLQCLLNQIMEGSFTRPYKKQTGTGSGAGSGSGTGTGKRRDVSRHRSDWVNRDDTVAHRNERKMGGNPGQRGGARGGHNGGQRGGRKDWRGRGGHHRGGFRGGFRFQRNKPY